MHFLTKIFDTYAAGAARVFETDRSQTIGASEIGQCARKLWYVKNEDDGAMAVARDPEYGDRWGARTRGSVYETHFWEPALRQAFGERLLYAGAEQRTFVKDFLSATPDGLVVDLTDEERAGLDITDGSTCIDLDCKTADPRTKLATAKPEHVYQVIVQIGLIREITNHRPTHGLLTYTDASFWDEVKPFTVAFDEAVYAEAHRRARQIITAGSPGDLKPEGVIAGGRECELCPFTTACGRRRADMVPANEAKVDMPEEIARVAMASRTARDKAESFMEMARQAEHELRDLMASAGARKMVGEYPDGRKLSISWAAINGRPSLDTKALKAAAIAAGIDITQFEKAGDPTDRLVITLNG